MKKSIGFVFAGCVTCAIFEGLDVGLGDLDVKILILVSVDCGVSYLLNVQLNIVKLLGVGLASHLLLYI